MTKNKNSTRYFSSLQENEVCKIVNGKRSANSGAGNFNKSDIYNKAAELTVECKTSMTEKSSFSIKREVLEKLKHEAFENRRHNFALCFNFGPNTKNYFVIDEKLMKFLVEELEEENAVWNTN